MIEMNDNNDTSEWGGKIGIFCYTVCVMETKQQSVMHSGLGFVENVCCKV